jgi:hypothetical protein
MELVRLFHSTYYPTIEVNYPKMFITDVENCKVPFVAVEFDMRSATMCLNPRKDLEVSGSLILTLYRRSGGGEKLFTTYSDLLYTYFGYKTLDSINFYGVLPYDRSGIPGFDGVVNYIRFDTDYFNV